MGAAVKSGGSTIAVVVSTHQAAIAVAVTVTVSLSFIALVAGGTTVPLVGVGAATYKQIMQNNIANFIFSK